MIRPFSFILLAVRGFFAQSKFSLHESTTSTDWSQASRCFSNYGNLYIYEELDVPSV